MALKEMLALRGKQLCCSLLQSRLNGRSGHVPVAWNRGTPPDWQRDSPPLFLTPDTIS
jgi:hypothetical protein